MFLWIANKLARSILERYGFADRVAGKIAEGENTRDALVEARAE